jgi:hypothetical protein
MLTKCSREKHVTVTFTLTMGTTHDVSKRAFHDMSIKFINKESNARIKGFNYLTLMYLIQTIPTNIICHKVFNICVGLFCAN